MFVGSARSNSHTKVLAEAIKKSLESRGVSVEIIDLFSLQLPPSDPTFHKDPTIHSNSKVSKLAQKANTTDSFVFLSPVYHNSYSALLKNALDNLAIAQFAGKAVGLASHGGHRTSQVVDHLRIVTRGLNAIAIVSQVCADESDFAGENETLVLVNDEIFQRIGRFTDELIRVGIALKQSRVTH